VALVAAVLFLVPSCVASAEPVIADIRTDKSRYSPGARVTISITLADRSRNVPLRGTVGLSCAHLDVPLRGPAPQAFRLAPGAARTLVFTWKPPVRDFQGYGVEAWARDAANHALDCRGAAVDVSSTWTRFPRYGFLSGFPAQPPAVSQRIVRRLADYHLNALQFYDWQWKHHIPLAGTVAHPAASWQDLAGRPTYRRTVLDLIAAAHQTGMAAMNYDLLYGAWSGYGADGVDYRWGLWKNNEGTNQASFPLPGGWATPTVYLFNPADAGWQDYLIGQEAKVFAAYPFDGWQVDQIGDLGAVYDFGGRPITLWQTFRPFLKTAKARLHKHLLFNNVGAYGLYDTAAHAAEDAVYVECWEFAGQKTYGDLKSVIDQASEWSGGKAVILAAYMNRAQADAFSADRPGRFNAPGVLLADAAIFASGGAHIELGDAAQMLDNEYFPNRSLVPGMALMDALRRYYDFSVAYENLLRGGLSNIKNAVTLSVPASGNAAPNTVWAFAKAGRSAHVLHLINLRGEHDTAWRDDRADRPAPTPQANLAVTYHPGPGTVTGVAWASPDAPDGALHSLPFTTGTDAAGHYVRFTVPRLAYWDMIYLRVRR